MAAAFAARIRHRAAVMESTTVWLAECARSSLSRIHSTEALLIRSPRSRIAAASQHLAGFFTASRGRQRHDLLHPVQPLPVPIAIVVQQAAIPVVGDQVALVLIEQPAQLGLVSLERRANAHALGLARGEHMIPDVHPQLGKCSRDVSERGEAGDLQIRHEPAPVLDRRQLQPGKDAKTHQRQERHGQQQDQAFGNRHKGPLVRSAQPARR